MSYKLIKLTFRVSDVANKESSDYLLSLCKEAAMDYDKKGNVIVFAIVKKNLNINDFVLTENILNSVSEENAYVFKGIEKRLAILNGEISDDPVLGGKK